MSVYMYTSHTHFSPDALCLLSLEEVEEHVQQVWIVIIGVNDIARGEIQGMHVLCTYKVSTMYVHM